ncbi:MAG: hypothetical protein QM808_12290 [Steroidobacteraceae bacterium]
MKVSLISLVGMFAVALSTSAYADCAFPKAPESIPDGKSASEPEMISAMTAFKQYNTDVDTYVACLDTETDAKIKEAGAAGAIMQIKAMQAKKKSSATDERQAKVNTFNEQVRTFKARKS